MAPAPDDAGLPVAYARPGDVLRHLGTGSLDVNERARAAQMSDSRRHDHFMAGRALLRHRLSGAAGNAVAPDAWRFTQGPEGQLSVAPGLPQFHFSISHADGLVAVATSPAARVGIDLERVTGAADTRPARDHLSDREQAWLDTHGEPERWPAFLQLWTGKEAVSKLLGLGCGVDFRELDIDIPARRVRCPHGLRDRDDQIMLDVQAIQALGAAYCLSVASV